MGKTASLAPRRLSSDDTQPFLIDIKKVKSVACSR